jgi:hypothetical protein
MAGDDGLVFTNALPMILFLPFGRGEGRAEGTAERVTAEIYCENGLSSGVRFGISLAAG